MRTRSEILPGQEVDPGFLGRIDDWVEKAAIAQPSADEFLALLPGVWPVEAVESLKRLEKRRRLPRRYRSVIEGTLRGPCHRREPAAALETPPRFLEHPLDFEWLFTREAQNVILRELRGACLGSGSTVLCLGCPTLFDRGKNLIPEQQFVLWDKNASSLGQMSEAHALADIDLRREPLPSFAAVAAVLDPPWYNDFYRLFLWAALRSVCVGGNILLSFPPEGTRPSAARDRVDLIQWARQAGAELISQRRGCLPYRSPLFEVNALVAGGFSAVPLDWRRGDLLVFRKEASFQVARPLIPELEAHWEEHHFGCIRLRVRSGEEGASSRLMRAVGKRAVLPSVSTRFPRRNLANVVTTGNRFFHITSPAYISDVCRSLSSRFEERDCDLCSAIPLESPGVPIQLSRLIAREWREAAEYFTQIDGL